jgi:hypothetical protein
LSNSEDFEIYDSDFDVEDGDDDLFIGNIEKYPSGTNEMELCQEHEDEDTLDDDELNLGE